MATARAWFNAKTQRPARTQGKGILSRVTFRSVRHRLPKKTGHGAIKDNPCGDAGDIHRHRDTSMYLGFDHFEAGEEAASQNCGGDPGHHSPNGGCGRIAPTDPDLDGQSPRG